VEGEQHFRIASLRPWSIVRASAWSILNPADSKQFRVTAGMALSVVSPGEGAQTSRAAVKPAHFAVIKRKDIFKLAIGKCSGH
jgi:hypothetical protein